MFLSIRHKPMQAEAMKYKVFDKTLGVEIPRVIWANDKTGSYRQLLVDDNDKMIVEDDHVKSKIFKGNIELRKAR